MAVGTPTITAPGAPTARDEAMFMADPRGFCAARISEVGPVFATGAFGGAVFVGGAEAVESVCAAGTPIASGGQRQPLELAPFAPLLASAGGDWRGAYESLCAAGFHEELYAGLFAWVPKFKETGGFSTFRFEDFIDPRVRKALPGARRLLFRATAPALLGSTLEALPPREGLSTVREWGKAYAALASDRLAPASRLSLLGQAAGLSLPARLPGLGGGGGGEKGALLAAALGEGRLADALDAVEPTAALVTSMLAMAERQGGWSARLAAEQKAALTGAGPEAPIDAAVLDEMPLLHAFALETLRTQPPTRPQRLRLERDTAAPRSLSVASGLRASPNPHRRVDRLREASLCPPAPSSPPSPSSATSCPRTTPRPTRSTPSASSVREADLGQASACAARRARRARRAGSWRSPSPRRPLCSCGACSRSAWRSTRRRRAATRSTPCQTASTSRLSQTCTMSCRGGRPRRLRASSTRRTDARRRGAGRRGGKGHAGGATCGRARAGARRVWWDWGRETNAACLLWSARLTCAMIV